MKIIEWIYLTVGLLFMFGFSLVILAYGVGLFCDAIRRKKENRYEKWAKNVCSGIDRWCDYEFPQVGFTVREISKSISSGWSFDESSFREKLRRGEWKPEAPRQERES